MLKFQTEILLVRKEKVYVVNLDIKKAYDSVIRKDVRDILKDLNVEPELINLWHALNYKPNTKLTVGGSNRRRVRNERGSGKAPYPLPSYSTSYLSNSSALSWIDSHSLREHKLSPFRGLHHHRR